MSEANSIQRLVSTRYQLPEDLGQIGGVTFDLTHAGHRAHGQWAVRRGGCCLSFDGQWEFESQPSSRDDAFFARCRFDSLEDALEAYELSLANEKNPDTP